MVRLARLQDLHQLLTVCVHINLNGGGLDQSRRAVRSKIAQVVPIAAYGRCSRFKILNLKELLYVVRDLRNVMKQANSEFLAANHSVRVLDVATKAVT